MPFLLFSFLARWMDVPWTGLDHVTILVALGSPLWWAIRKIVKHARMIEEDHKKVVAMWRDHGYNAWDGVDRRRYSREFSDVT